MEKRDLISVFFIVPLVIFFIFVTGSFFILKGHFSLHDRFLDFLLIISGLPWLLGLIVFLIYPGSIHYRNYSIPLSMLWGKKEEDWYTEYAQSEDILNHKKFEKLQKNQISYILSWSWEAYVFPFVFALSKKLYLYTIGLFVPFLGIYVWTQLSINGRKLAWEKGSWEKGFEHFIKGQNILKKILIFLGLAFYTFIMVGLIFYFIRYVI